MKQSSGYFFRREPCPCCDSGPLILVKCPRCGVVMGWCGESDYAVGRVDGVELFPFERGEHPDWARKHCPSCGAPAEEMGYADAASLGEVGLLPRQLMWSGPDGSITLVGPEWRL